LRIEFPPGLEVYINSRRRARRLHLRQQRQHRGAGAWDEVGSDEAAETFNLGLARIDGCRQKP